MATLETQYKQFKHENPYSAFTYDEWLKWHGSNIQKAFENLTKKENNMDWKLKSLSIEFKKGYSFEQSEDRYEGFIKFENNENESFQFKIRPDMANDYIKLISEEIINNAESLSSKLIDSLGLKK